MQSLYYMLSSGYELFDTIPQVPPALVFIVFCGQYYKKGLALWKASKFDQRNWFIVPPNN